MNRARATDIAEGCGLLMQAASLVLGILAALIGSPSTALLALLLYWQGSEVEKEVVRILGQRWKP